MHEVCLITPKLHFKIYYYGRNFLSYYWISNFADNNDDTFHLPFILMLNVKLAILVLDNCNEKAVPRTGRSNADESPEETESAEKEKEERPK